MNSALTLIAKLSVFSNETQVNYLPAFYVSSELVKIGMLLTIIYLLWRLDKSNQRLEAKLEQLRTISR